MRAFVFPGQGTQFVGMARALTEGLPRAREVLAMVDEVCGEPLSEIMDRGPAERLMETEVTQPAVLAYSLALLAELRGRGMEPDVVAGYSLGEYAALVAARALTPEEAVRLVRARAKAMVRAHPLDTRSMAVVLGPTREELEDMLRQVGEGVWVAGYCTPTLFSMSGTPEGLARLEELAGSGFRPVPVSLPFHSPKLQPAVEVFAQALDRVELKPPVCPVVPNVTANPTRDPDELRRALLRQIVEPVRWVETLGAFREMGVTEQWEIGPGRSLTTYLRKTDRKIRRVTIDSPAAIPGRSATSPESG